ncbi:hypothetical protein FRC04_005432 [Tulasnella sp. 424]|nr:hypothetical protein FRC04_005432 [Tulasnella sp. 424]KAG8962448.1 hypothetical protein FRC05_005340 [Tulasnella sp. 425]
MDAPDSIPASTSPPPSTVSTCTAPINHLPDELLLDILSLTFHRWRWHPWESLCLGLVCKRWHDIVMSSAIFWPQISSDQGVQAAQAILHRNLGGDLIFDLDERDWGSSKYADEREAVLKLALAQIHRWKTFCFWGNLRQDLLAEITAKASSLKELLLNIEGVGSTTAHTLSLGEGPPLSYLSLSEIGVDWSANRLTGLQTLSISHIRHGPTSAQLYSILSSSPFLNHLTVQNVTNKDTSVFQGPPIHLPLLTNTYLHQLPDHLLTFLVAHLTTESCTSIRLETIPPSPASIRALSLATRVIQSASPIEVGYEENTRVASVKIGPVGFMNTRGYPEASILLRDIRLDEVLLGLTDIILNGEGNPDVRLRVSSTVFDPDAIQLIYSSRLELRQVMDIATSLTPFLKKKLSEEWIGARDFIRELRDLIATRSP